MNDMPAFLPPKLELSGSWESMLGLLYSVFEADFKHHQTNHQGLRVFFDRRILPDGHGKEEGFWHVISKQNDTQGERRVDFRRAERLPWGRPLMEADGRPEILVFDYNEGPKDKNIRRYIWLREDGHYGYALILQRKKQRYFWVTAFYVQYASKYQDLMKRYQKRVP
jgi:hypothetical protein